MNKNNKGFTLIELVIVVAIVSILYLSISSCIQGEDVTEEQQQEHTQNDFLINGVKWE